eukprot:12121560-Ditylum_brightwellii.AAC.1
MKQLETNFDSIQAKKNRRITDLHEKLKKSSTQPIDNVAIQKIQEDITEVNNAPLKVADSLNDCLEKSEKANNRKS